MAQEAFGKYLEHIADFKFGGLRKAARAAGRSREHYFNCIKGHVGLDAVRRLALNLSLEEPAVKYFDEEVTPWETADEVKQRMAKQVFKVKKK